MGKKINQRRVTVAVAGDKVDSVTSKSYAEWEELQRQMPSIAKDRRGRWVCVFGKVVEGDFGTDLEAIIHGDTKWGKDKEFAVFRLGDLPTETQESRQVRHK